MLYRSCTHSILSQIAARRKPQPGRADREAGTFGCVFVNMRDSAYQDSHQRHMGLREMGYTHVPTFSISSADRYLGGIEILRG